MHLKLLQKSFCFGLSVQTIPKGFFMDEFLGIVIFTTSFIKSALRQEIGSLICISKFSFDEESNEIFISTSSALIANSLFKEISFRFIQCASISLTAVEEELNFKSFSFLLSVKYS